MRTDCHRRGQSLVEFALILPLLLLVLVGIVDFGRAVYSYNLVSNAARTAVRVAIVNQSLSEIQAAAQSETVGFNVGVAVTYSDGGANCSPVKRGCSANVEATSTYSSATPLIDRLVGPITLKSTASMPVERVSSP